MKITSKLEITRQDVKTFLKIMGIVIGQSFAWMFILPLDYTFARPTFVIVQYLPIVSLGLIVLWVIRYAIKEGKRQKLGNDAQ